MTDISNKLTATMHVTYIPNIVDQTQDALIVKQRILDKDTGIEYPVTKIVRNYQVPFWTTKTEWRNHGDKREYEELDKLDRFECTRAELPRKLANVLKLFYNVKIGDDPIQNMRNKNSFLKKACNSPYVYGTDISASAVYKYYEKKREEAENGSWRPKATVAVADYETDMLRGHEQIISGAITFGKEKLIVCDARWLGLTLTGNKEKDKLLLTQATPAIKAKLQVLADKHIKRKVHVDKETGQEIMDEPTKFTFALGTGPYDIAYQIMQAAHALKPDFLAFWNANFDVKKMLLACETEGHCPTTLFCDPRVPADLRFFNYHEDKPREKENGTKLNKGPADFWHVVTAAASFYLVDSMCVFRMLRAIEGLRQSYSLQAITTDEGLEGKLYTEGTSTFPDGSIPWHRDMQANYPLEYSIYNMGDCDTVLDLDAKTTDLSVKLLAYADGTDLANVNSNPRRLLNSLHFYLLERNRVIAGTGSKMSDGLDELAPNREEWIVTLANELNVNTGVRIFDAEWGEFLSTIALLVADIDITSGYPTTQMVLNACKSSNLMQVCVIGNLDHNTTRRCMVDLINVPGNAVTLSQTLLNVPKLDQWVEMYQEHKMAA